MHAKFLAISCLLSVSLAISVPGPSELTSSFLQRKNGTGVGNGICPHIEDASICEESAFGCHFVEGIGCENSEEQPDFLLFVELGVNEKKLLETFVSQEALAQMHTAEGMDLTVLSLIETEEQNLEEVMLQEINDMTLLIQQRAENPELMQTNGFFGRDLWCKSFKNAITCDNTVLACEWNWWRFSCKGQAGDPPLFSWESLGWVSRSLFELLLPDDAIQWMKDIETSTWEYSTSSTQPIY